AAFLCIDQHIEREEERKGRSGSLIIRYHVYDDYAPARFQSAIETLEEIARRLFAFGMHYVAQKRQIITILAEVNLFQIARQKVVTVFNAVTFQIAARRLKQSGKILRRDVRIFVRFCNGDAPDA